MVQSPESEQPGLPQQSPASPSALFRAFLRLGATAFGGPAMVTYIRELAVVRKRWLDARVFSDGVALCQAIPGATAMQTAAYVGLRVAGVRGALAAFVGFGLPAFVLMLALSAVYQKAHAIAAVAAVFRGLQVVVVALVANAAIAFGSASVRNRRDLLIGVVACAFLACHGNPIAAIAASALLGAALHRAEPAPAPAAADQVRSGKVAALVALLALPMLGLLFLVSRKLCALGCVMLKVDLLAFGGGFAAVPLMLHEVVDLRHWMNGSTFMDGIALGQATPGPIVITATFAGYQIAGLAGACVATLCIFTPSFLLVLGTVPYLDRLRQSALLQKMLRGILASFAGLLFAVAMRFGWAVEWSLPTAFTGVGALVALRLKLDILWVVLAGAAMAALFM